MAHTVELTEGISDPPPIRIGTTGTIASLMIKELESLKMSQRAAETPRKSMPTTPVTVLCGSTPRKTQLRRSVTMDPSSSSSSNNASCSSSNNTKTATSSQKPPRPKVEHHIPMLDSVAGVAEKTSRRKASDKKASSSNSTTGIGCYIVEVVDVKCSSADKIWSGPITSLKKLGFSKLSDSSS